MSAHVQEVQELLAKALEVSPQVIDPDANLFVDFGVDSLGLFNLMVALEERHAVRFHEDDMHTLRTVRRVADYLESLIRARAASA